MLCILHCTQAISTGHLRPSDIISSSKFCISILWQSFWTAWGRILASSVKKKKKKKKKGEIQFYNIIIWNEEGQTRQDDLTGWLQGLFEKPATIKTWKERRQALEAVSGILWSRERKGNSFPKACCHTLQVKTRHKNILSKKESLAQNTTVKKGCTARTPPRRNVQVKKNKGKKSFVNKKKKKRPWPWRKHFYSHNLNTNKNKYAIKLEKSCLCKTLELVSVIFFLMIQGIRTVWSLKIKGRQGAECLVAVRWKTHQ